MGFNGPEPIAMSEIESFLRLRGIEQVEERKRVSRIIRAMDDKFLEYHYDEDG